MRVRPLALALLGLLAGACSSSRPQHEPGRLVRADELPVREREVWERYHAGGAGWELERERVLADPELARFLVDNLVRELVQSYDRSRLARPGEQAGPFERAGAELVRLAPCSTSVLAEMLALHDGIVSFLAADLLARIGCKALEPVCAKLGHEQAEVRRRAAELLGRLPHAGASEVDVEERLGARAEKDEAWIVRAQAAQALGARGALHTHKGYAAGVLARCLCDADPAVAESAAKGLRALAEPRAIPILIDALERNAARGDVAALRATQGALRELSGQSLDRTPEEWRRWWREEGERTLVH
jgi:hypothetical protein